MTEPARSETDDAAAATPRGTAGGRATLVTIDQGLSSITNLLAVLWVAHAVSAVDFGSFALLILVYTFVVGAVHALISMRVVVAPEDADDRPREVLGSALVLGLGSGLVCAVVGALQMLAGWSIGPAILVLGLTLPAMTVHDVGRWVAIARSKPVGAVVLDGTWLAVLAASLLALELSDQAGLVTLTLAWTCSGALAALWVPITYGMFRPKEISLGWLRKHWEGSWRLLVGNVTASGSALVGGVLIAFVSSPLAVAAVRGSILLGRPTTAVQMAVASSAAADIARDQPDNRGLLRYQRRTMTVAAVVALVNLVVLSVVPDSVGRAVLGNVWPVLDPLILPISLWLIAAASQSGVASALVGRHEFHIAMIVQIIGGVLSVGSVVVGAIVGGPEGAVWALFVGQVITSGCWWTGFLWHLRRTPAGAEAG
ncbi:MATE family efflux transporter [Nocardioides bizhenqiangii]|uniref:Polysaccharide biosynthesis protein n=1 Tax=Nocardioides bizhenqiangii TaxID=3095076 RepID=A0ABZ0ZPW6_9ACTN|nr:hypothetical protein [Nocardioides sp. HM61]WQQ25986.1 hypothetical protein SHK19_18705 [Nocardioides sp. HM61]